MRGISRRGHRTRLAPRAISDCWVILMRTSARLGLSATAQARKLVETGENVLIFLRWMSCSLVRLSGTATTGHSDNHFLKNFFYLF